MNTEFKEHSILQKQPLPARNSPVFKAADTQLNPGSSRYIGFPLHPAPVAGLPRSAKLAVGIITAAATAIACAGSFDPIAAANLANLSIEELANIEITSVSKRPESLSDAAAAVYVITRDDIRRSGAESIPEILRLAPNLQVAAVSASEYAITARGFNSTAANKLLVLIDGRSVYTPLYSGVFWDIQDVGPENIERIEVISGPGGTLWGANAVNGVINIITRTSADSIGNSVSVVAGTNGRSARAEHGGRLNEDTTYRLSFKGLSRDNTVTSNGVDAQDSWHRNNIRARVDWEHGTDTLSFQGNVYDGSIDQPVFDNKTISGGHALGRWNRQLDADSSLQVQTYFDKTRRIYPGTFGESLDTFDLDVQHRFNWGKAHDIVWGGDYRFSRDDVTNSALLAFLPAKTDLKTASIFLQDSIALDSRVQLTVGSKLEHNYRTGIEFQPNARLNWKLQDQALLWSAISRAVRTPSRIDTDFYFPGNPPYQLAGGPDFQSEKLTAYEIGYRMQPLSNASLSISTFYNAYDKLRSVESLGNGSLILANKMEGNTYGVETWGTYRINDWWRLTAGYNYLRKRLALQSDSHDLTGVQAAGNDPSHQFSLRSAMNPAPNVEFDIALRSIGALPDPAVPAYTALDARLGWSVSKEIELSLAGFNLLDQRHPEFGPVLTRNEITRSFYLKMLWKP